MKINIDEMMERQGAMIMNSLEDVRKTGQITYQLVENLSYGVILILYKLSGVDPNNG